MNAAVGFIGLGRMGGGMAANLVRSGADVVAYDADPAALDRAVERGARAAGSAAQVARAGDPVFLCLPFAPEVEAVLFGEDGVAAVAPEGLTVIDATTLLRDDALAFARRAAESGIAYHDCPVSGMPFRAENGTLTMMFGGDEAAFSRARPLLEAMGEFIVHCGPLGSGQLMKALNNVVYDVNIAAICEILPLAVAAGLPAERVAEVLTTASGRSFASEYFVPRILARRFGEDFPMGAAYKDIVNVRRLATELRAPTPVADAMTALYQSAMAQGLGGEPKSAMVKVYERLLGVEARGTTTGGPEPDGGGESG